MLLLKKLEDAIGVIRSRKSKMAIRQYTSHKTKNKKAYKAWTKTLHIKLKTEQY